MGADILLMLILFDIFLVYHSISAGEKHNVLGFRLDCVESVASLWRIDVVMMLNHSVHECRTVLWGGGPFTSQRRVVVLFPVAPLEHVTCSEVPHLFVL